MPSDRIVERGLARPLVQALTDEFAKRQDHLIVDLIPHAHPVAFPRQEPAIEQNPQLFRDIRLRSLEAFHQCSDSFWPRF